MDHGQTKLTIAYIPGPADEGAGSGASEQDASMLRRLADLCRSDGSIALILFDRTADGAWQEGYDAGCSDVPSAEYRAARGRTAEECCNEALDDSADSAWIAFLRSGAAYDPGQIPQMLALAEAQQADAVSFTPVQDVDGRQKSGLLYPERDCMIDLEQRSPNCWNLCLDCYLLRRAAVGERRFDAGDPMHAEHMFLIEFFAGTGAYYIHQSECRIGRFLITDADSYRPAFSKSWYVPALTQVYQPLLQAHPDSRIIQSGVLYLIRRRLYANRNNWNKEVLRGEELQAWSRALGELLQYIDDDVLIDRQDASAFERVLAFYLLKLKYGGAKCRADVAPDGEITLDPGSGAVAVGNISDIVFQIDAMNYSDRTLRIDGELKHIAWADYEEIRVLVQCGNQQAEAEFTGICRFEKLFGETIWRGYMVQASISEEMLRAGEIRFFAGYRGEKYPCETLHFARIQARLHDKYVHSYWVFGKYIMYKKANTPAALFLEPATAANRRRRERSLQKEIKSPALRRLRRLYHLTRPFYRGRRIWITCDQLFKGGDNGEYFYHYVREHHPKDVEMYYLVNEEGRKAHPEWRSDSHMLSVNSGSRREHLKMQLLALHADQIFSTRASVDSFFGFHKNNVRAAVCDLFHAEISCIQHGLTVQKIAQYQNRIQDNMKLYYCASPFEKDLICRPVFGYNPKLVSVTGSPRYDGLTGSAGKQILIAPTWRRNLTDGPNRKGEHYAYNPSFKDSEYYRIYQGLISDERLLACAKETGYRILLVLHPNIGAQEKDFTQNEQVRVKSGIHVDYEKLMVASKLMVTDYSGIQFDFAYMRKPLVYYRPESLPPQYEEGVRYEDMQFGPAAADHEEAVASLCEMMRRDCRLEDAYREKIDRFFPYDDRNNCERICQTAMEFQQKLEREQDI